MRGFHETALVFLIASLCGLWACKDTPSITYDHGDLNPDFLLTPDEAYQWHLRKDAGGPTYSGSSAWVDYMTFVESKLEEYGVIDISRNTWSYDRWYTSEWPDNDDWSLVSDGDPVRVAHYGAYSGSTDEKGVTAELLQYNPDSPPESMDGKIVVFETAPHPESPDSSYRTFFTLNDYEFVSDPETYPPLFTRIPVSTTVAMDVWYQLRQTSPIIERLRKTRAAGAVVVFDASYDRLAGLYTFPVPLLYDVPTLFLDRVSGKKVIEDARKGKSARLKLAARVETVGTYQLIGYLPGRDYGTERDEKVLLITHTDGPSISQENGGLGLLALIHYLSHIPQIERSRTLMLYMDNRHYMPGMEAAWQEQDWFTKHPEAKQSIVAVVAMEHLGQMEYNEEGEVFAPTGLPEISLLWTRDNPVLIDTAVIAVKDNQWPRCRVECVERPGIHGETQGIWYGMGAIAMGWNVPAFACMGSQGAYWGTTARIDRFDRDLFSTQVAAMTQLTGALMSADLSALQAVDRSKN